MKLKKRGKLPSLFCLAAIYSPAAFGGAAGLLSAFILFADLNAAYFTAYGLGQLVHKFNYARIFIGSSGMLYMLLQFLYKCVAGGIAF